MSYENLLPEGGELFYFPQFLTREESQYYFEELFASTKWQEKEIKIFGKLRPQPRLIDWVADDGLSYSYSGLRLEPHSWSQDLMEVKKRLEDFTHYHFNSVLLNLYRNQYDSNGWHSDDEKELGEQPMIASLSLGESRDFLIKHKDKKHLSFKIHLTSGSLLIMKGDCQKFWKHCLPKRTRELGPRINLTFRNIVI